MKNMRGLLLASFCANCYASSATTCETKEGTCRFPFTYDGITFNGCTAYEETHRWCYVRTNRFIVLIYHIYGRCPENCPTATAPGSPCSEITDKEQCVSSKDNRMTTNYAASKCIWCCENSCPWRSGNKCESMKWLHSMIGWNKKGLGHPSALSCGPTCPEITDEQECASSGDSRYGMWNSACVWCCGKSCTARGKKCEAKSFLESRSDWNRKGLSRDASSCEPACYEFTDEQTCTSSTDGRLFSIYGRSPCIWCCGNACTTDNKHICEPSKFLFEHATWNKKGKRNGVMDTCGAGPNCAEITNEETCVSSRLGHAEYDGKIHLIGPCIWCCGIACTTDNENKCESVDFLVGHDGWDRRGKHSGIMNNCIGMKNEDKECRTNGRCSTASCDYCGKGRCCQKNVYDPLCHVDEGGDTEHQCIPPADNLVYWTNYTWGGTCQCPDGSEYEVSDRGDACKSSSCIGGEMKDCTKATDMTWAFRGVMCRKLDPPCSNITDERRCVSSKDGRLDSRYAQSPCIWCCGNACTTDNKNKCEPLNFLLDHKQWNKTGRHGDFDTCGPSPHCAEITNEEACVSTRGGRISDDDKFHFFVPCIWCCGIACTSDTDNKCERLDFLENHPGWHKKGEHSGLMDTCGAECHKITDDHECASHTQNRVGKPYMDSPCIWCCGNACTTDNENKCETLEYLLEQASWNRRGKHCGILDNCVLRMKNEGKECQHNGWCSTASCAYCGVGRCCRKQGTDPLCDPDEGGDTDYRCIPPADNFIYWTSIRSGGGRCRCPDRRQYVVSYQDNTCSDAISCIGGEMVSCDEGLAHVAYRGVKCLRIVNGGWSEWTACTKQCGDSRRTRRCNAPIPRLGGDMCDGLSSEICVTQPCPIHCEWDTWSKWKSDWECALNSTRKSRYRAIKVLPKFQGNPCNGSSIDVERCSLPERPLTAECSGEKIREEPTKQIIDAGKKNCHQECRNQCTLDKFCAILLPNRHKIWQASNWAHKWFGTAFNRFLSRIALGDSFAYPTAQFTSDVAEPLLCPWLLPTFSNSSNCDYGHPYPKQNVTHVMDNFYHWYLSEAEVDGQSSTGGVRRKISVGGKKMRQEDLNSGKTCISRCKIWCFEACKCNWGWDFPYSNDLDVGWRYGKPMRYRWIRSEQPAEQSRGTWKCVSSKNVALQVPWDSPFWSLDIYSQSVKTEGQRKFTASGSLSDIQVEFRLTCQHVRDLYAKMTCGEEAVACRLNCTHAPAAVVMYLHHERMLQSKYMNSGAKRKNLVKTLREGIHKNCRRTCAESHVPDFERAYPNV